MKFKNQLIQRHKNPIGLLLRVATYVVFGFALWKHSINLIFLMIFIDLLNWFFMPMVKPKNELKIVNKVVQIEINWIKSPWTNFKILTLCSGILFLILVGIGLWMHNLYLLVSCFILFAMLKQLVLKTSLS